MYNGPIFINPLIRAALLWLTILWWYWACNMSKSILGDGFSNITIHVQFRYIHSWWSKNFHLLRTLLREPSDFFYPPYSFIRINSQTNSSLSNTSLYIAFGPGAIIQWWDQQRVLIILSAKKYIRHNLNKNDILFMHKKVNIQLKRHSEYVLILCSYRLPPFYIY